MTFIVNDPTGNRTSIRVVSVLKWKTLPSTGPPLGLSSETQRTINPSLIDLRYVVPVASFFPTCSHLGRRNVLGTGLGSNDRRFRLRLRRCWTFVYTSLVHCKLNSGFFYSNQYISSPPQRSSFLFLKVQLPNTLFRNFICLDPPSS